MIGAANQIVQQRIVEDRPPAGEIIAVGADTFVAGIDPIVGDRGTRRLVIGTDFAAIMKVFRNARTPTNAQYRE